MTESRFHRLRALFDAALERPPEERADYAIEACAGDDGLRDELLRLLRRQHDDDILSDQPALPALDAVLREAIPDAFDAPRRAGPFRLEEALGDGGMGRVYRAVRDDGEVEQEVAIKLVRGELLNPALLARFSVERRLLASLNHPNICRFLDAGTLPDGTPYVAMERVHGEALFPYCERLRLGLAERVRLLRKVAAAVGYAHRQLIVHRDIKSSNVLVDADGEPKLLDFGIATSLADGSGGVRRTLTAERFLTPSNAAPEQLRGEPTGVGCDIHALGLLAYELLSGRPAFDFDGLRAGEIERLLLQVPPPPMSQRAASGGQEPARARSLANARALSRALSNDLDAVVATCLRKAPEERYASVEQLDAELGNWLENRPVRARGGDRWYRARKFVARHRASVALTGLFLVTLVTAATMVGWQAMRLADERNRVVKERDRAEQVVDLLQDAFIAADPARVSGGDVSAREVLAAARPRIEVFRDTRPDLYISLAATVAEVEQGLSLDADAAQLASRAIDVAQGSGAPTETMRALLKVQADASIGLGESDAAQRALDRIAALDSTEKPDWLVAQGRLLHKNGKGERSLEVLWRARALMAKRGPDDELATHARWEEVQALRSKEDYAGALAALDATLAWQRTALPDAHARVALSRMQRVDLLRQSGDLTAAAAEAEAVHRDLLAAYGDRSAMAARSAAALGMALYSAAQVERGIAIYDEGRQIWIRALGPTHPQTIRATFNLARMLEFQPGREGEAEPLFESALQGAEARHGTQSNATIYMRLGLAGLLLKQRRWHAAMSLLSTPAAREGIPAAGRENHNEHREFLRAAMEGAACVRAITEPCRTAGQVLEALVLPPVSGP